MTTFVFANNVSTTLAAAASSGSTTLTLGSSTGLPTLASGQMMPLTLNDAATRQVYEVVYVTAISGSTLTVERGQEGTSPQSWAVGDYAFSGPTAGTMAPVNGNPNNVFEVADSTSGTADAVPRTQADTLYAALNGSSSETFDVAAATAAAQAVNLGQFSNSFAATDYLLLPNGFMLQWVQGSLPASGGTTSSVTVALKTAFPNFTLGAWASLNGSANSTYGYQTAAQAHCPDTGHIFVNSDTLTGDSGTPLNFNQTVPFTAYAIGR